MRRWRTRLASAVGIALLLSGLAAAWWMWNAHGRGVAQHVRQERAQCPLPAQAASHRQAGMVWIPGGVFDYGDTLYPEEGPVRRVAVDGFWIDRTEVTNDQFAQFVRATGYVTVAEQPVDPARHPELPPEMRRPGAVVFTMPNALRGNGHLTQWWRYTAGAQWRHPGGPGTSIEGRGAFPVVAVTHADALAYARWRGTRLPTEVQWEWAARASHGATAPGHAQPQQANTWQGLFPVANAADDGFVGLAPVGCFTPDALGLFDMIGNVWELTADLWTPDHSAASPPGLDPAPFTRPGPSAQRVIKGGSFLCAPNYCMRYRAGARQPQEEDLATSHLGFRTILAGPGP